MKRVRLVVVGAHLRGLPLHGQLTERGAVFVREARTAAWYALYELAGTVPAKPGLLRTVVPQAQGIEVEVYEMGAEAFGEFVALVGRPLTIGTVELEDGSWEKGFLVEHYATLGAREITGFGGWRKFLASGG